MKIKMTGYGREVIIDSDLVGSFSPTSCLGGNGTEIEMIYANGSSEKIIVKHDFLQVAAALALNSCA